VALLVTTAPLLMRPADVSAQQALDLKGTPPTRDRIAPAVPERDLYPQRPSLPHQPHFFSPLSRDTATGRAGVAGFTAAGLFGPPGQQNVAVWTSGNGASWKPARSSDLNGSDGWRIDALAPSGSAVTGIGTIVTQQSQQTVTFTLPTR